MCVCPRMTWQPTRKSQDSSVNAHVMAPQYRAGLWVFWRCPRPHYAAVQLHYSEWTLDGDKQSLTVTCHVSGFQQAPTWPRTRGKQSLLHYKGRIKVYLNYSKKGVKLILQTTAIFTLTGTYKRAGIAKDSITYQFKRVTRYKFTQVDYLPQMLLYIFDTCLKNVLNVMLTAKLLTQ